MTITVYGLPPEQCRDCWATELRMRARGIQATKVRLDENPEAMKDIEALGYRRAPVVVVTDEDGEVVDHWSGFHEVKIAELAKSA